MELRVVPDRWLDGNWCCHQLLTSSNMSQIGDDMSWPLGPWGAIGQACIAKCNRGTATLALHCSLCGGAVSSSGAMVKHGETVTGGLILSHNGNPRCLTRSLIHFFLKGRRWFLGLVQLRNCDCGAGSPAPAMPLTVLDSTDSIQKKALLPCCRAARVVQDVFCFRSWIHEPTGQRECRQIIQAMETNPSCSHCEQLCFTFSLHCVYTSISHHHWTITGPSLTISHPHSQERHGRSLCRNS